MPNIINNNPNIEYIGSKYIRYGSQLPYHARNMITITYKTDHKQWQVVYYQGAMNISDIFGTNIFYIWVIINNIWR